VRVRFAPSPTGQLHVGNARTALFNWLLARGSGGVLVLRIEDTDVGRSTRASEASMVEDLRWLRLDWDEGPEAGGPYGPYRASERLHLYESYAHELLAGGRAYYCFCTPAQLEADRQRALAEGRPARYPGTCRGQSPERAAARVASGERAAVRFRVPDAGEVVFDDAVRGRVRFPVEVIGDPIILRADGHPAYNFAVVVDDALMQITHVVRGEDHIPNTPRQILLYEAMGFQAPVFAHLALVLGPDHAPLSKRHGVTSIAEFRARGYLPEAMINYLALLGWSPRVAGGATADDAELMDAAELARRFSLEAVGHSAGVFDEGKLAWVNRHYLKEADPARVAELVVPHFAAAGVALAPDGDGLDFLASTMPMVTGSVDRLDQAPARLAFLFHFSPKATLDDPVLGAEMRAESAGAVVAALADVLAGAPRLDREAFRAAAAEIRTRTRQKGRGLFHPIRVALTGLAEGPELDLAVPAIDRGAELPEGSGIPQIRGCRERARAFADALSR
jgi:nondiscriminating glutamyl-tRNA synthetase